MKTKPIVAATDGSAESLRAVEWAAGAVRHAVLSHAHGRVAVVPTAR
jgi:hypothetical protein